MLPGGLRRKTARGASTLRKGATPPILGAPDRPDPFCRRRRPALPRELSDFLIALSIALHKHAMYPEGHPTLAPSADAVLPEAAAALAGQPSAPAAEAHAPPSAPSQG